LIETGSDRDGTGEKMKGVALLLAVVAVTGGAAERGHARTIAGPPAITAKAAIVVDHSSGEILFARNPDLQLPPASTTKVLSALVAVQTASLDQVVRVSQRASRTEPRKIWLRPGWTLDVDDLLHAMLLYSANDASVVLAEGLAGSVGGFAELMNATAWRIGATRSHFENPSGLPGAKHYSTARDLATIMHHALQRPILRRVLSTHSRTIRPHSGTKRSIPVRSHNRFLDRRDKPVIGKTGFTRRARRCFVGAAFDGEHEILVSLLGSNDLWGDLDKLVDYGLRRVSGQPPLPGAAAAWQEAKAYDENAWRSAAQRRDPGWETAAAAPSAAVPEAARRVKQDTRFRYHVYVASFRTRARADRLRQQVTRAGYPARVERIKARRTMYRVTVPDFTSRDLARRAARALRKAHSVEPLIVAVRT
jgi:D-alanyl-D-alanine carboxypeptidase